MNLTIRSPHAWLTESRIPATTSAPDAAVLDAITATLTRKASTVVARSADAIEFKGPGLLGEGAIQTTLFQQLRGFVRRGTITLQPDGAGRVLVVRVHLTPLLDVLLGLAAIIGVVGNADAQTRLLAMCGIAFALVFLHVGGAHSYDFLVRDAIQKAGQGTAAPTGRISP